MQHRAVRAARVPVRFLIRGASPLGLPHALSRAASPARSVRGSLAMLARTAQTPEAFFRQPDAMIDVRLRNHADARHQPPAQTHAKTLREDEASSRLQLRLMDPDR